MVKNYLQVAWRNMVKHRAFTLINILGLSLSMSVCLVIILLIFDHYQYDTFHSKADQIYRIISYSKGNKAFGEGRATTTLAFKNELKGKYPSIENYSTLNLDLMGEVKTEDKIVQLDYFDMKGMYADEEFFNVFDFELIEGIESDALSKPNSVILSNRLAELLFPDQDPMGKLINYADHTSFIVTGILEEPPGKGHLRFDLLASYASITGMAADGNFNEEYDSWESHWSNYNYLVISDPQQVPILEKEINRLGDENTEVTDRFAGYDYELQRITDIVPGPLLGNEVSYALPGIALIGFGILGLIVIVTASINYSNLSIAKSLSRAREIGIRKANGAQRHQIILQFLIESTFLSLISLGFSVLFYRFLIDQVNSMWIFSQIQLNLQETYEVYFFFLLFTLFIGLITGIGPSLFLSRLNTIKALSGSSKSSFKSSRKWLSGFSSKKIMLSIQFSLAIIMLITIFLIHEQSTYFINSKYGFDETKVQYFELQGNEPERIIAEFENWSGVEQISFTSHHPAVGRSHGDDARRTADDEWQTLYYFSTDSSYIDVMNLNLIAGSNFPNAFDDNEKFLILNEKAVEKFGFESPSAAIGETLTLENDDDDKTLQIIGVVQDYNWEPLMKDIRPLALRNNPENYEMAYFKMGTTINADTDERFKAKWSTIDPARDYKGGALAAELDLFYQFMIDLGGILSYVGLLALVITLLGFLGMISFELKSKTKEIGIRKVLGASFGSLLIGTTRGFLIMLAITAAISIPLAISLNSLWLYEMANHVDIGMKNVGPAVLLIAALCGLAIWTQVRVNTSQNPAHTLRNE